jgi:hypothetical protein
MWRAPSNKSGLTLMGYTTTFTGELKFTHEPSVKQIVKLKSMFSEDCRDHPDWNAPHLSYIDLEFNDDYSGIRWNGAEKTYDMDHLVNVVICEMIKEFPEFGLTGTLHAQGEDAEDRWQLVIGDDGFAKRIKVQIVGTKVECPNCEHKFYIEEHKS